MTRFFQKSHQLSKKLLIKIKIYIYPDLKTSNDYLSIKKNLYMVEFRELKTL